MKMRKNAFTLVEMLAIITILGVLLTVTLPNIIGISERESTAKYAQIEKNMGLSAETYITSNMTSPVFPITISYRTLIDSKLLKDNIVNPITGEKFDPDSTYVKVANSLAAPTYSIVMVPPEGCFTTSGNAITDYNFKTYNYTTWQYDYLYPGCPNEVIIPETIGGVTMTTINSGAFNYDNLTFVYIPSKITSIGTSAFANNSISSINIPSSVTTIANNAFSSNKLTSITIPSSVTTIDVSAFAANSLTSIYIPSSVTTIGAYAFDNNKIKSIVYQSPISVTSIGGGAFNRNLMPYEKSLIYARTVTGTIDYTKLVSYAGTATSITIPTYVTTIGQSAFENTVITSIVLPISTVDIQESSFRNTLLTKVIIPNNVTTIGNYAFYGTRIVTQHIPNSVTTIGNSGFSTSSTLTSAQIDNTSGSVTLGSTVFGAVTPTYLR